MNKLLKQVPILILAAAAINFSLADVSTDGDFSMTVADVFTITGTGVVITGVIKTGVVTVGDTVCLESGKGGTKTVTVDAIEMFRKVLDSAKAGDAVGLILAGIDKTDVEAGDRLSGDC
jgi:elongation factor Tu